MFKGLRQRFTKLFEAPEATPASQEDFLAPEKKPRVVVKETPKPVVAPKAPVAASKPKKVASKPVAPKTAPKAPVKATKPIAKAVVKTPVKKTVKKTVTKKVVKK